MTSCCAPPAFLLGCRLQEAAGGGHWRGGGVTPGGVHLQNPASDHTGTSAEEENRP